MFFGAYVQAEKEWNTYGQPQMFTIWWARSFKTMKMDLKYYFVHIVRVGYMFFVNKIDA